LEAHQEIMTILNRKAVMLAALALTACASSPKSEQTPASSFKPAGNADLLLARAIETYAATRDPAQVLPYARGAAEQAPKRPELVWLYAHFCAQAPGCDAAAAETQLRKLDAANGVAWMGALSRAMQQRDTSAQEQVLEALSRSERIDVYWTALVSKTGVALHETSSNQTKGIDDPLTSSLNKAADQLSQIAIAALRPIVAACGNERIQRAANANRCLRVAQILQQSDTYIAAGIGLGIEERVATPGTPTALAVNERVRITRYQQETAGRILESQVDRPALSRQLIKLMQSLRREQEVFGAVLRWAGQPTTPPPEWTAGN
jgi:hypothetical protein